MSRKRKKQQDPNRERRIHEMLKEESEVRESLNDLNRRLKDFSDHAHYDKIQRERVAIMSNVTAELQKLFDSCMDMRGKCISAEWNFEQKAKIYEDELNQLFGIHVNKPELPDDLLNRLP